MNLFNFNRGRYRAIIAIITLLIGFWSCDNSNQSGDKLNMFRYNMVSGISSLDPAYAKDQANMWVVNQLYDGLVRFDNKLNVQAALAKRWQISDDGLTYTFYLRDDVYFHDCDVFSNRKLVADDVAYSLSRLISEKQAFPGAWLFNGKVAGENAFMALNDTTFQIKLLKPYSPLLSLLTLQYCYVVAKEAVEHYGQEYRSNPVGTGPFKFKAWKEGQTLVLLKNDKYFMQVDGETLPYIDGVKVSFIESKQTEYLNFMNGNLDFISGLDVSYADNLLTAEGDLLPNLKDSVILYKMPYLNTEYLGILITGEDSSINPLQSKLVRQAISNGFDREHIVKYLRNNIGKPAHSGFVPYGMPSFNEAEVKGYTYNPDKAMALLVEAGFPAGEGLPEIILYTNPTYQDMATYIARQLNELGIKVKMELAPGAFLRELMAKGEAKFFRGSWIADYADAENYLSLFYGENGAPPNYTRFKNAVYDSLYVTALTKTDIEEQHRLYRAMDQLVLNEAVVIPLFYDEVLRFVQPNVKGLEPNAMNMLDLRQVKIK